MLGWSMAHRWAIILLCLVVILSVIPLYVFVGKSFLPVDDQSQFEVTVRTKEGSSVDATSLITDRIAKELSALPGVTDTLTTIGGDEQERVNRATIYVKLKPIEEREFAQDELMTKARDLLAKYPGEIRTSVQQVTTISGGGSVNADILYFVAGPDLDKLGQYSAQLLQKMKTIPDAVDADTTLEIGNPELRVSIDRPKAADLGVRVTNISRTLNILVAGDEVSTFNAGVDQYDVRVRAIGQSRTSAEDLQKMLVNSTKGGHLSLDNVVTFNEGIGPATIERYNRQRQVTLSANVRPGGSQADVIAAMNGFVSELNLEPGYTGGVSGRSRELARSIYYFILAISLSFIFMYIVLAAQFESFIHPITILLTLPLAIPFGIISLLLTGQTVNVFSGLGLLLLFGVVKKNAILQIDHTNELRKHGKERYEAIIQANRDRLRPILMTTIALVVGMLPLVISSGPGAGTNRSIGVLVVGGQSLCLLLTLLAVPVLYSLFDDAEHSSIFSNIGHRITEFARAVRRKAASATSSFFN